MRCLAVFVWLFAGVACSSRHEMPRSPAEQTAERSAPSGREEVIGAIVQDWQRRWSKTNTALLLSSNVTSLLKQGATDSVSINSAGAGLLHARILRDIRNLNIQTNTARADLLTETAKPPDGLVAGTGEAVILESIAGRWRVTGVKTISNDDYAIGSDHDVLSPLWHVLPK